ncbi:hypothetical protein [Mucilaginibacter jinjuensis]|uniref:Uncharacterized protein n=1 Tax=Mucilaginibacter jinjuensis TaxID=1176721 RepID=A0ABY7TCK5_9SPHI|nr:hypothetical protein [Mucilaginibacter jinjuensis]WCT13716.1 hypothetical protein PQO05_07180 [Mucilaginibacter jinjuensis]
MQSLLHHRMQEEQLISKIRNQEASLRKKREYHETAAVLDNIKQLQMDLAAKQLEIERILNAELKKLVDALKNRS